MKNTLKTLLLSSVIVLVVGCVSDDAPTSKSTPTDIAILTEKAEQGDAQSQFYLAMAYYNSLGVKQSYKTAAQWLQKSAEQGFPIAQNDLGTMYDKGQGVKQSNKMAVQWYRKVAEQGVAEAQLALGAMYLLGIGVKQDKILTYAWVQLAAKNGNSKATKFLEILEKKLTPKELAKAKKINPLTVK